MLSRLSRRRLAPLPGLLLALFESALAAVAPAESAGKAVEQMNHAAIQYPSLRLPSPVRGEAAFRLLGPRLNAIAARYGGSGSSLAALLQRDADLWLDDGSRLFYSCRLGPEPEKEKEKGIENEQDSLIAAAPFPLEQTFELHSLPESNRVIHLDFDGHTTSGTEWNRREGEIRSAPWSLDGDRSSFNTAERTAIQDIWQGVAEDYAPFDVDVTTQDPGVERLRRSGSTDEFFGIRVVISPTDHFNPGAGGVAYVGSFAWDTDTPCFAFTDGLDDNPKAINEASSHEAGHTLGLSHDGIVRGTGYYQGHGDWAPIMGVGYYRPVTQWSKGEYSNANNREDDLALMPSYGCSQRLDDAGNTPATATALVPGAGTTGVISNRTDVDLYSFQFEGGPVAIQANPARHSPNLNIKLGLYGSDNQLIIEATGSPLSQQLGRTLPGGSYFVRIDGEGDGTPASGYTDYASLGQYTLRVSPASTVAGRVLQPSGGAVSETQILLKNASGDTVARTSSNGVGAFSLGELAAGRYTVSAVNASYTFTPPSVTIDVPPSRSDILFNATAIPVTITKLKIKPAKVRGGRAARGTVTINIPAVPDGIAVTLTSDKPEKASPTVHVLVPPGATAVDFDITTSKARKKTTVKITAKTEKSSKTAKLTVL